jgi:AcrR family transcriptional regulator
VSEAPIPPKRARTATEKLTRRRVLLQAAQVQFCERGFEGFSMAELARQAGVAKGTLYLYFETREEVLLTLYCDALDTWQASLVRTVPPKCSHAAFADAFYAAAHADALFLPLMSRLDSVIEHNVSIDALVDAKRTMRQHLETMSRALAPRLGLAPAETFDAIASLGSLLLGAAQIDAGPTHDDEALPQDVRHFMQMFSSRDIFTTNACRILAGIRAGAKRADAIRGPQP